MKTGLLWQISIATSGEAEEAVAEMLERFYQAPSTSCQDLGSGAITVTVFLENSGPSSRPPKGQLVAGLEQIRAAGLDSGPGRISIRRLKAKNWAESWKWHFKPIEIGKALLIRPSWSRRKSWPGQAVVVVDPGLSFGTGQHPTTLFCLEQIVRTCAKRSAGSGGLERKRCAPKSCLDVGCGSGILAIAAAKLGCAPVEGFDFDPDAVRIARGNALQNGVKVRFHRADVASLKRSGGRRFDLVCANLTADLLVAHWRCLSGLVSDGGLLALAGILDRQFPAVRAIYEQAGLRMERTRLEGEWRSGAFRRLP